jgi:hypothetical protein
MAAAVAMLDFIHQFEFVLPKTEVFSYPTQRQATTSARRQGGSIRSDDGETSARPTHDLLKIQGRYANLDRPDCRTRPVSTAHKCKSRRKHQANARHGLQAQFAKFQFHE